MKTVTSCILGLIAVSLIMLGLLLPVPAADNRAGAAVKVVRKGGHGSGVHIGDGYILTAAHVVKDVRKTTLLLDNGEATGATVLWTNEAHDVALLHTERDDLMQASALDCRDAKPGESVRASGNPYSVEFVSMWGHIAGTPREHGPWASVLVMDVTVAPGMSGGPVYDSQGRVIGLSVGTMMHSGGFTRTLVAITYAVPSSAICHLMARE